MSVAGRSLRRVLVAAIAVGFAGAQSASRPTGYRTFIETFLLDRSPCVYRARLKKTIELGGAALAAYDVKATLKGEAVPRVLLPDADVAARRGGAFDQLLFAAPMSSGVVYKSIDVVDLPEGEGDEIEALVRRCVALAATSAVEARREGVRKLVFDACASRTAFSRTLGAREFVRAREGFPGAFLPSDAPRLRSIAPGLPPSERGAFLAEIGALEAARTRLYAGVEASVAASERELFLTGLEALDEAPTALERTEVVRGMVRRFKDGARAFVAAAASDPREDVRLEALGLSGVLKVEKAAPAALRALHAGGPKERRAAAECLGRLRFADAVRALAARAADDLEDAEVYGRALGRIGDPAALAALDDLARLVASQDGGAEAAARLLVFGTRAFAEADALKRDLERRLALGLPPVDEPPSDG
jgi:hypothetical protein